MKRLIGLIIIRKINFRKLNKSSIRILFNLNKACRKNLKLEVQPKTKIKIKISIRNKIKIIRNVVIKIQIIKLQDNMK